MAGGMSFGEIEQLWIANGGSPAKAPIFAAIAMAESGGNATALNNNPATGDYSVGLWQINYFDGLLASRTASYGSPATLQGDANAQARAAISLSNNGTNLQPWTGDAAAEAVLHGQPIPAQYTGGAPISTASFPNAAGPGGGNQGANCTPIIGEGGILGIGSATLLNSCQGAEIVGGLLIAAGGVAVLVGIYVLLQNLGMMSNPAAKILKQFSGGMVARQATKTQQSNSQIRMAEREHSSGLRITEAESKASARRYGRRDSFNGTPAYVPGSAPPFPDE